MYYDDNTVIYLNGKWLSAKSAKTGLYQQSFHYGNGVFEGIRSYATDQGTKILRAKAHFERLLYSAKTMYIDLHHSVDEMIELTYQLLEKNNLKDAYIRPLVYTDERLGLQAESQSNLFLCAWDWSQYFDAGDLKLKVSPYCRPDPNSCHVDAKVSGHYVNSILATKDAHDSGFDDALLLDQQGHVAEASGANFFLQKDGVLYTPPKGHILPGITRSIVMEMAAANGIAVKEKLFKPDEIYGAQGAFLTGTAVEIKAIGTVDNKPFSRHWEDTFGATLQQQFQRKVRNQKVEYKKVRAA
ncbi:branched-chain amino acid transaminase [Marinicella litoralis]|uniref:Branched-chain-amino-acid aminotransferase n=1 Tax=Marinicella litoralis TaxID=644220 RepID=A0A4R6XSX5_9GAMM|nr:branched-chain amino acid transaminase [Marinicella litoralis]TDR20523.1 branched-chain amino acid aminotransferase [Marinicella litoralis]